MHWTTEGLIFLAIGLIVLIFEAHRQFIDPTYEAKGEDQKEFFLLLSPSVIRNRTALASAELVYLGVIVSAYLFFLLNEPFRNVINFIIDFFSGGTAETVGGNVPAGNADAAGAAEVVRQSTSAGGLEGAALPFIVSMAMVMALRFPGVRRIEQTLRTFAYRLFGIPGLPEQLCRRIVEEQIDIRDVDQERTKPDGTYIALRDKFTEAAIAEFSGSGGHGVFPAHLEDFPKNLSKLIAFKIWVHDEAIWPSKKFQADNQTFNGLNNSLKTDISILLKDLDLLVADSPGPAAPLQVGDEARASMRRELWVLKLEQASKLCKRVCAVMALCEQNAPLPSEEVATASSLRKFLKSVRAEDDVKTTQVNLAILLVLICAVISAVAGVVHAEWLTRIARDELDISESVLATDPQFNPITTAIDFVVSSLIVYGFSIWIALDYRRKKLKSDRWINSFKWPSGVPPMVQWGKLFVLVGLLVFAVHFVYSCGRSMQWNPTGARDDLWWANVYRQTNLSIIFAVVGGVHGVFVAIIRDIERKQFENGSGKWVIVGYVALMALLGVAVSRFVSSAYFRGVDHPSVSPILNARQIIYSVDLGLIALLTSLSLILFANQMIGGRSRRNELAQAGVAP